MMFPFRTPRRRNNLCNTSGFVISILHTESESVKFPIGSRQRTSPSSATDDDGSVSFWFLVCLFDTSRKSSTMLTKEWFGHLFPLIYTLSSVLVFE
ncbi:hypothetical protein RJT34_16935 [Clitoria ternatea]|uniref:Uncharacterized protein n=1 Tax=Clitoria ternatea TaxID=43366 RepID=A0AAN9J8A9_CLITE